MAQSTDSTSIVSQKLLKEDLEICLDAIYDGQPLEHYFEAMMRVQARLSSGKDSPMLSVQALYDHFIEKAKSKMRQIRNKIISDMKVIGLVRVSPTIERVQSLDDYDLLTSAGYSGRQLFTSNHCNGAFRSLHLKEGS